MICRPTSVVCWWWKCRRAARRTRKIRQSADAPIPRLRYIDRRDGGSLSPQRT